MKKYDVIILGAGPGGYTAAAELASQNLKVAIIEKDSLGGTCVNYGCIPTKALLSSAKKLNALKHYKSFGFNSNFENTKLDLKAIQDYRKILRNRLNGSIANTLKEAKVEVYQGYGEVIDTKSLKVNNEILEYDKLILATGTKNRFLNLPNFQKAKDANVFGDSDYFLFLEEVPKSLAIIGGGPISVEFAYLYAILGTQVTILQDLATIIPQFDKDAIKVASQTLENLGVKILTGVSVKGLDDNFNLEYEENKQSKHLKAEKYMLSVGRVLNSESFENLNLKKDERGRLVLNEKLQTSLKNVYAIGDITSQIQLTNVAYIHSSNVVRAILNKPFAPLNLSNVPYALYISPEIASIGISEQNLEKIHGSNYLIANLPASSLPRNHAEQTFEQGFFKLIIDKTNYQILGAHIALDNASIIINEIALAMTKNLTIFDLVSIAHTHPTLSEAIFYASRKLSINLK